MYQQMRYTIAHIFQYFIVLPRDLVGSIYDPLVQTPKTIIHYSFISLHVIYVQT